MKQKRYIGSGLRKASKGGSLSNMKQLAEDFAQSIQFGKSEPTESSDRIKKKFSI